MGELITTAYQRLFEVRLLHHYWLDEGATLFDNIAPSGKQQERLLTYDVRPLLSVTPTATTTRTLSGYNLIFKQSPIGFLVAAPSATIIPAATVLEFMLSINNPAIFDYTALTMRAQKIYELFNSTDKVTYRYKENVPVLSNLTGTTRGAGPNEELFLSREIPAGDPTDAVESLVMAGPALLQLTGDNPGGGTQQLAAQAADYPVFVNQGDAPVIVPPAGLAGTPARGVRLSDDVTDDVFALITLTAVRADNDLFSFVDGAGAPIAEAPVYQVRFKNRSTIWTYLDKTTGAVKSASPNPLPLTFFGNAGTQQKPSRGHVKADLAGGRITRLISEIRV